MRSKSTILALLFLAFSFAQAQEDSSTTTKSTEKEAVYQSHEFFPKKGDVGTTILLSGLIDNIELSSPSSQLGDNILFVRYYLEDDLVLRLGLGVSLRNYKQEIADSLGLTLVTADSSNRSYSLNISAGIEKHMESSNRLDPYIFGQLNLTFIGKENIEVNGEVTSNAGVGKVERTIKKDGGFGLGIVAGAGLNYFLAKRFSLGTELGLVFQYSSIGGTTSDNTITTPINGSSVSDFNTSDDTITKTEILVNTNALINISYFF